MLRLSSNPSGQPPAVEPDPAGAGEVDVWWGSYSGRALAPALFRSFLITVVIAAIAWILWDEEKAHPQLMWHTAIALVALVWGVPLARGVYRIVGVNYRLTTRRLYRDRGFHRPADGEVELARVQNVFVEQRSWERQLGVGRIVVVAEQTILELDGVVDPEVVAEEIRRASGKNRC